MGFDVCLIPDLTCVSLPVYGNLPCVCVCMFVYGFGEEIGSLGGRYIVFLSHLLACCA